MCIKLIFHTFFRGYSKFVSDLNKMMSTTRDCGDRICTLFFQIVETCILYVKSETHPSCDVPCDIRDCKLEIYHDIECPVWDCALKPNSTTTTIAPIPITTSTPPTNFSECSAACIIAISFALLFALCFGIVLALFVRNRQLLIFLTDRFGRFTEMSDLQNADERTPIIRRPSDRRNFVNTDFVNVDLEASADN